MLDSCPGSATSSKNIHDVEAVGMINNKIYLPLGGCVEINLLVCANCATK
jgi:hypothetical protein